MERCIMIKTEFYLIVASWIGVTLAVAYIALLPFMYVEANEFGWLVPEYGGFHITVEPWHLDK
jgi:hypothetical protein